MEYRLDGDSLTLYLEGRIDSSNAGELTNEMMSLVNEAKPATATLDLSELKYISSAGLRAIMKLGKTVPAVAIIGVSREVYEVLEMTGLTQLFDVKRARRNVSVEGCKIPGLIPPEAIDGYKSVPIAAYDQGLEPICF